MEIQIHLTGESRSRQPCEIDCEVELDTKDDKNEFKRGPQDGPKFRHSVRVRVKSRGKSITSDSQSLPSVIHKQETPRPKPTVSRYTMTNDVVGSKPNRVNIKVDNAEHREVPTTVYSSNLTRRVMVNDDVVKDDKKPVPLNQVKIKFVGGYMSLPPLLREHAESKERDTGMECQVDFTVPSPRHNTNVQVDYDSHKPAFRRPTDV